jgi:hypothetical protein
VIEEIAKFLGDDFLPIQDFRVGQDLLRGGEGVPVLLLLSLWARGELFGKSSQISLPHERDRVQALALNPSPYSLPSGSRGIPHGELGMWPDWHSGRIWGPSGALATPPVVATVGATSFILMTFRLGGINLVASHLACFADSS